MSKFYVDWVEQVSTKTGKSYKKATLKDESGAMINVSVWPDYSGYPEVLPGAEVHGMIRSKGNYNNLVSELERPQFIKTRTAPPPLQPVSTQETYDNARSKGIREAQDNKEKSVIYFNSMNVASSIVAALIESKHPKFVDIDMAGIQKTILKIRDWAIKEHNEYKETVDGDTEIQGGVPESGL